MPIVQPRDDNGSVMLGMGLTTRGKRFTSIDTDGTSIELGEACNGVSIWCDEGPNAWIFVPSGATDDDEITVPYAGIELDIAVAAGVSIGTVKAVTGTVNCSVVYTG
jgi:hypothetical protein